MSLSKVTALQPVAKAEARSKKLRTLAEGKDKTQR